MEKHRRETSQALLLKPRPVQCWLCLLLSTCHCCILVPLQTCKRSQEKEKGCCKIKTNKYLATATGPYNFFILFISLIRFSLASTAIVANLPGAYLKLNRKWIMRAFLIWKKSYCTLQCSHSGAMMLTIRAWRGFAAYGWVPSPEGESNFCPI